MRAALLPEWWSNDVAKDPRILSEAEFSVARFLQMPVAEVADPTKPLRVPSVEGARLRRPAGGVDDQSLAAPMHAALAIAKAVVRNLRNIPDYEPLPYSPSDLRTEVLGAHEAITLRYLVGSLWDRGIPVVQLDELPSPRFRGMACVCSGRPMILLGQRNTQEPKVLINVGHEAGHIARNHVSEDAPQVDLDGGGSGSLGQDFDLDLDSLDGGPWSIEEFIASEDPATQEREANYYMKRLLLGDEGWGAFGDDSAPSAWTVRERARDHEVDAGLIVHFWQISAKKYKEGGGLLKELDKTHAGEILREYAEKYIDIDSASETDANLLRCVLSDAPGDR